MEVRRLGQITILGIESSCDETAAAVVRADGSVLSSVVASQYDIHALYGGVVPELASREHLRAIVPVVREALIRAEVQMHDLSAVAVTAGPGLVGSLLVGVTYAKSLCFALGKPLLAVNHVEGHIHSVLLGHKEIQFPAVALVVSGGHTHLYELPGSGAYRLLGKTRDDAAGEAYDKVAKLLGFGYPGGPTVDLLAPHGNPRAIRFTVPRMKGNELDFSFSGLKTAVLRWTEEQPGMKDEVEARRGPAERSAQEWLDVTPARTLDLLASFQHAVTEELLRHALAAANDVGAEDVLIAGGVAQNRGLRAAAEKLRGYRFYFPGSGLATDNAVMIAAAGVSKLARGDVAGFDLRVRANLSLA